MGTLLLRFAGPIQSWAGYRVSYTTTGTHHAPTKSGVAGFLGACLGEKDYLSLLSKFDLRVRMDRVNPTVTDLQVASPTKAHERPAMHRELLLATGKPAKVPPQLTGTALSALANRDVLVHSEFICAIETDHAEEWGIQTRNPVYMPYLGRRSNVASFPVRLGWTDLPGADVISALPHVPRTTDEHATPDDNTPATARLRAYRVTGDYHHTDYDLSHVVVPLAQNRKEQLQWASQHLSR